MLRTLRMFGNMPEFQSKDFEAYMAARVLEAEELAELTPKSAVIIRAKLYGTLLSSDKVKDALREAVEPDLKNLANLSDVVIQRLSKS